MIKETALDKILFQIKKIIPKSVFGFFQPIYHQTLAYAGAMRYGFPSRGMKVIGVTGTKGKSTVVYMIARILEEAGEPVAAIGSLGFKIKDKEWPNTLKMTMPGRFRLQRFLSEAKKAGCKYVVLEVTSEGIVQKRHLGIKFDCAVFTNIHKEHLESHGSFENYLKAKQQLFKTPKRFHILNADDPHYDDFFSFGAKEKISFGIDRGEVKPSEINAGEYSSTFQMEQETVKINLGGRFNILNALAAWSVGQAYGVPSEKISNALAGIKNIPGRLEFVQKDPFGVVVDYAHTPDSLEAVYRTLKPKIGKLICVLGAAGGGRDKWKRPEFGAIAERYADEIILTDEDPYEEDPAQIISEIQSGISNPPAGGQSASWRTISKVKVIMDRKEAIGEAIKMAQSGDCVVITGKGSEISMAISGNRKIPWSDREIAKSFIDGFEL